MNEFTNTNYSHNIKVRGVGVYYIYREKRGKRGVSTIRFYFVRVEKNCGRIGNNITTIGKAKTRKEAEEIFKKNMPYWDGEIPYYEEGSKRLLKRTTVRP